MTAEESQRYSAIIDSVLVGADLESISRRTVVKALEAEIGKDTSYQKVGSFLFSLYAAQSVRYGFTWLGDHMAAFTPLTKYHTRTRSRR